MRLSQSRRLVVALGSLLALVLATGAHADQSYTDTRDDAGSGPDIIAATVRHDAAANLVFQIQTANFPATNHVVSVYVDSNNDNFAEIWIWAGKAWSENIWGVHVWNGSDYVHRSEPSFRAAGVSGKLTEYRVNARAIGVSSSRFAFWFRSLSVDYGSSGWRTVRWDASPNSGTHVYELASSQPPPSPPPPSPPPSGGGVDVDGEWIRPDPPQAGRSVVVGANFVHGRTGKPVRGGAVSCRGSLGSRSVPGKPAHRGGTGTCTFALPADAGGKAFRGRVRLTYQGASASSEMGRVVAGAKQLAIKLIGTNTGMPQAGQAFQASFAVELRQPGSKARRVDRGTVSCPATLGASQLRATKNRFLPEFLAAQCEWQIPSTARGSTLKGRIVVKSEGLSASKSFSYRVR